MQYNYETPEMPGASKHTNSANRDALAALLEAHTTMHTAQAGMLDFQLTMARRAAAVCEALERQLLSETDSVACVALAEQINTMYSNIIGLLFDMAPTPQDNEGNETDDNEA